MKMLPDRVMTAMKTPLRLSYGFCVKLTAGRKTKQSKLRWKDEKSSTNSRSFKELLVNNSHKTSTSRGLTTTKILWRTSRVYHV